MQEKPTTYTSGATSQDPLVGRYASPEMVHAFSEKRKHILWRKLWIALAEAEHELGLPMISKDQIEEMRQHVEDIDYEKVREIEARIRHEVMAHLHAYGLQCPRAKPIIHLGATSAYILDNADLIIIREGLEILRRRLVGVINELAQQAQNHRHLVTVAFTHFQPASLTTVGKRISLWLQDFVLDLEELEFRLQNLRFHGARGAVGTQASLMALFDEEEKVNALEGLVAEKMGFKELYPVAGQTYPRKVDAQVLACLSGIAQSAHRMANDLRLLQNLKEMEEPFETEQVGSSAMPQKRNPVLSERLTGLARYVLCSSLNPAFTAASQWFERTLDDSSNRRLSLPGTFLATEALLNLVHNIAAGTTVYPKIIDRHIREELPFLAMERILMEAAKVGGDRQILHERLRVHAMQATRVIKEEGGENDLLERIASDPAFAAIKERLPSLLEPRNFIGRAPQQVEEFLQGVVEPLLKRYKDLIEKPIQIKV
ncbi:MAG TPA: adenylosuccinate lyase [Candidatus Hypogeohydataceae bacterium YC41]